MLNIVVSILGFVLACYVAISTFLVEKRAGRLLIEIDQAELAHRTRHKIFQEFMPFLGSAAYFSIGILWIRYALVSDSSRELSLAWAILCFTNAILFLTKWAREMRRLSLQIRELGILTAAGGLIKWKSIETYEWIKYKGRLTLHLRGRLPFMKTRVLSIRKRRDVVGEYLEKYIAQE